MLSGECTLIVEEEERPLRTVGLLPLPSQNYTTSSSAPAKGPCAILMIGAHSEAEQLHYPVSEVAARYGASAAKETPNPGRRRGPGEFVPVRLPWPVE